jgi:hypothetical protein
MPLPPSPPKASPLSLSKIRENLGRLVLVIYVMARNKSIVSINNKKPGGQIKPERARLAVTVAAGILACRGAGLPSPAGKSLDKRKGVAIFAGCEYVHGFSRAARMPSSTSGKDA